MNVLARMGCTSWPVEHGTGAWPRRPGQRQREGAHRAGPGAPGAVGLPGDRLAGPLPPTVPLPVAYWLLKAVLTPVLLVCWRVRVEGREHVPAHGPVILAANHQSFCDSLFLPLVVPRKVTYLAKAEYFDSVKTAWFFRAVGQIPIRRGGGKESERAIETAKEELEAGHLIALYPEGTRSLDRWVHRGRTGVARLSRECGVDVVPVGLAGTVDVQPVGSRFLRPWRTVTVRFGAPMRMAPAADPNDPMVGHDHRECRAFTDALMHEIARLSGLPYVDEYVPRRRDTAHDGAAAPAGGGDGTDGTAPSGRTETARPPA